MRKLIHSGLAIVLATAVAATIGACQPKQTTVETKSETKTTTPAGDEQVIKTESEQVGDTLEATQETKTEVAGDTTQTKEETVIGTVEKYEAGKSISIKTAENDSHSFDLGEKDTVTQIEPGVAVGSRVMLVREKQDDGQVLIRVSLHEA